MIVTALSVDHCETSVTDTVLRVHIQVAVQGTEVGADALSIVGSDSVVTLALSVDVGLIGGTDGVAEPIVSLEAGLAETLIGVAVVVESGRTVGADSLDADVLRQADTLLGDIGVELVQTLTGSNGAGLSVGIIGFSSDTLGAGSLNDVVSGGTVTIATVEVIELVGSTLISADPLVDIIDLTGRALGTEVVDKVESGLTNTTT